MPFATFRLLPARSLVTLAFTAGSSLGCGASASSEQGAARPEQGQAPRFSAPPAPPPPRCEELLEGCLATATTRLSLGTSNVSFAVPEGWLYANASSGGVALHPDGTALIALGPPSSVPAPVEETVEQLALRYGISGFHPQDFKKRLKKPQETLTAESGNVDLWEVQKNGKELLALRDKGAGTLLVLRAEPSEDAAIVGIGFVVEAAADVEAPRVMLAVRSLRSGT